MTCTFPSRCPPLKVNSAILVMLTSLIKCIGKSQTTCVPRQSGLGGSSVLTNNYRLMVTFLVGVVLVNSPHECLNGSRFAKKYLNHSRVPQNVLPAESLYQEWRKKRSFSRESNDDGFLGLSRVYFYGLFGKKLLHTLCIVLRPFENRFKRITSTNGTQKGYVHYGKALVDSCRETWLPPSLLLVPQYEKLTGR